MCTKAIIGTAVLALTLSGTAYAQEEDLLSLVNTDSSQKQYVDYAFKSTRVIMSHSLEMLKPGVLDFRILHRFGPLNSGASNLFGLDESSIRLGLDYGLTRNLTLGIGRTSVNPRKDADGFVKYRLLHQSTGNRATPVSLLAVAGATMQTNEWADKSRRNYFSSRLGYYGQVILGRKFSEALTLQVVPTFIHRNLVVATRDDNDTYAIGTGGRLKLGNRVSLNVDYYYVLNKDVSMTIYNPLSVGFDIETGGHVFQLHFTNAIGMNERSFVTETTNDWGAGDIQFGFNISRVFQIKKARK
ncbi:MAG TPA: DUF5777 family beta-barrel protein [Chitinophagaceae bacterium]